MTKALSPSSITRGLRTSFIGRQVLYYPTVTSTMDAARQAVRQGALAGTVVIAGEQTDAKGRLKRAWISPPGNIALSLILYPDITALPYLIMIASLAVSYSVEKVAGRPTQIKWPNDILIDGKKVAGILIENEVKREKVVYSIIGIGINIDMNVAAFHDISSTAASLESGMTNNLRVKIIRSLLIDFERLYLKLPDGRDIFKAWRDRLGTLGKPVRATARTQIIEGIAESVDRQGALLIRSAGGDLTRVIAGDVTLKEK